MAEKLRPEQYEINDTVATCLACGAYSLSKNPQEIEHYPGCKGINEIKKWDDYYAGPERARAAGVEKPETIIDIDKLKVVVSQEAILRRIGQVESADIFGEYTTRLIGYLDYEHAKPFLVDDTTEDGWEQAGTEILRAELHRYMEDWWKQKVEDGRGISVHRGRAQVVNLLFLAGVEAWLHIGIDDDEGIKGGQYQENAYNAVADLFGMPHIKGARD